MTDAPQHGMERPYRQGILARLLQLLHIVQRPSLKINRWRFPTKTGLEIGIDQMGIDLPCPRFHIGGRNYRHRLGRSPLGIDPKCRMKNLCGSMGI